jgi:hypothetical protein
MAIRSSSVTTGLRHNARSDGVAEHPFDERRAHAGRITSLDAEVSSALAVRRDCFLCRVEHLGPVEQAVYEDVQPHVWLDNALPVQGVVDAPSRTTACSSRALMA